MLKSNNWGCGQACKQFIPFQASSMTTSSAECTSTLLAFTTETEHDTALASSELLRAAVLYLGETNMHGSYT